MANSDEERAQINIDALSEETAVPRPEDTSSQEEDVDVPYEERAELTTSILGAVDKYMTTKTNTIEKRFERILEKSSEETLKKATKKIKLETPELKRPGCKDQFEHNQIVFEHFESAERHIRNAELKEAMQDIDEGKKIISKRQKLVQLADREETGWAFVKEYVADDLASGSDDEKKIAKCRATANRKLKAKDLKNKSLKSRSFSNRYPFRQASYNRKSYPNYQRSSYSGASSSSSQSQDFRKNRYDRQCYACGRRGHLVYSCPERQKSRY